MTFGEKLIHLRKAAGMSQEELAQKLYLSRQAVHKWENGLSMPDIDNLRLLSSTFSVSIDSLLDDSQTLPALTLDRVLIAEKPAALSYGKVQRSGLTPQASTPTRTTSAKRGQRSSNYGSAALCFG